nr:hypothetical protein [Longispora sp. (in: high G+C Gram-positive bacteria)]
IARIAGTEREGGALGRTGTDTELSAPSGVAVDAAKRTIFIADTGNHRVLSLTTEGAIARVAGTERKGNTLGRTGRTTALFFPRGVAVDAANGTVFVADTGNHRVLALTSRGAVSHIAGSGQGNFLAATGTKTQLNSPYTVDVDRSGRVIIADTDNHRILAVTAQGAVSRIAGIDEFGSAPVGTRASTAPLRTPFGVAVTAEGRVLITDSNNNRLLETWHRP